jgi:hypothetical protein
MVKRLSDVVGIESSYPFLERERQWLDFMRPRIPWETPASVLFPAVSSEET